MKTKNLFAFLGLAILTFVCSNEASLEPSKQLPNTAVLELENKQLYKK